jgi:cytochrome b561
MPLRPLDFFLRKYCGNTSARIATFQRKEFLSRAMRIVIFSVILVLARTNYFLGLPMPTYSRATILLHWLVALLIVCAFALGTYMTELKFSLAKLQYYSWHKWLGITILGLVAIRLIVRLLGTTPPFPDSMKTWEKDAANLTHGFLYFLMFAVPISGYLYTYAAGFPVRYLGLIDLPALIGPAPEWKDSLKLAHEVLTRLMLLVVAMHVAAALKHQFIDKDSILSRMLPMKTPKDTI